ncbi:NADH-Ubiquinone oxidoreductase 39KDa subunit [Pediculus humanus corporis]|uniref:NADH-Ubiquinone oxidoreductase 39kDa subunit n=1 Tax=Pediculus humanus subsp. corporis TaxID=121224 RepID=E0W4F7_PEDHC|nr:NADH-Ubiquinone oxidoreductase 39KDa subunit [Pediculus humanus corporis]EEB20513.1 NADH-Ubiquinone oxidoreductase 39KDa subunit [Pediculus humanus corporis]
MFSYCLRNTKRSKIYPDPEKFDPMRHAPEEKSKRENISALYFGEGPRICIGNRFGFFQVKVGLLTLLSSYRVSPCEKTPSQLKFNVGSLVLTVEGR